MLCIYMYIYIYNSYIYIYICFSRSRKFRCNRASGQGTVQKIGMRCASIWFRPCCFPPVVRWKTALWSPPSSCRRPAPGTRRRRGGARARSRRSSPFYSKDEHATNEHNYYITKKLYNQDVTTHNTYTTKKSQVFTSRCLLSGLCYRL